MFGRRYPPAREGGIVAGERFSVIDADASLGVIDVSSDGERLRIRPVRSARLQVPGMLALSALFVLVGFAWSQGNSPAGGAFGFMLASITAFVGVRMIRASVVFDHERVVVRNVWATSWVSGSSITAVRIEERRRGSLWSWGLDASLPLTWVPLDVVVIEGAGRRIVADALRSDRRVHQNAHPAQTVARVRADVIERWRSMCWPPEGPTEPTPPRRGP